MADLFDDVQFADSHVTKIPVVLLADISGSMEEDGRIEATNKGMEQLRETLSADTLLSLQADICVIGFNHELGYQEFRSGRDFKPPLFTAKGGTLYAPGIHFAFNLLDSRKMEYREAGIPYKRAIIVMITDGNPHDSEDALVGVRNRIFHEETGKHCRFYTMGMADADLERLAIITPPGRPPKYIGGPEGIAALIEALSGSISQESRGFGPENDPLDSFSP